MRIKKYEAGTIKEAIKMVKNDFGSEAIILHSKTNRKGGVLGLFQKEYVEVLAGIDINILENKSATVSKEKLNQTFTPQKKTNAESIPKTTLPIKAVEQRSIEKQLQDILDGIHKILFRIRGTNGNIPYKIPGLDNIYAGLQTCGISKQIIDIVFTTLFDSFNGKQLKSTEEVKKFVHHHIFNLIRVGGVIEVDKKTTNFSALIGPTGVGKTTTIAKLAANYTLLEGKNVGLITIDTFRIAAIDQLKTFAEIINIKMEVVYTPDELPAAMKRLKNCELVLIDTAGRSPHHNEHMQQLQQFMESSPYPINNYLVLSVSSKLEDILNTMHRFESVGYANIILTKIDETKTFGNVLDIMANTDKPISYIATGQNVPDDLEMADAKALSRRILNNFKG